MPLSIAGEAIARRIKPHMLANTGHDILQRSPFGRVIKRVETGQYGCAGPIGQRRNIAKTRFVISAVKRHQKRIDMARRGG